MLSSQKSQLVRALSRTVEVTSTSERHPNPCLPGEYPNHHSVDWSQGKLAWRTFQSTLAG